MAQQTSQINSEFTFHKTQEYIRLTVQVIFSSVVLGLCIYQLITGGLNKDGKDNSLYWGGLTSLIAWWMPSPGGGRPINQANVGGDATVNLPSKSSSSKNEKD